MSVAGGLFFIAKKLDTLYYLQYDINRKKKEERHGRKSKTS